MEKIILAIETSCDETAVAIVKGEKLLANIVSTQVDVHAKYGGVMPEQASRLHAENITIVLSEALEKANLTMENIDAVAVTRGPGLIGALHVGLQTAKTLAMLYNIPLIPVHHLAGHIYANEYVKPLQFPLLAIVVSGGNTEFVIMNDHLNFEVIGQTIDDAVGECFDKVARVLGLPYPGGIPIDRLAKLGKPTYKLPTPHAQEPYDFSYSGLKTAIINLVHGLKQKNETVNVEDLCASFQQTAIDILVKKALKAQEEFTIKQVVLAGGVSANSYLRAEILAKFSDKVDVIIPPMWCCTDNAAMIAKLGQKLLEEGIIADLNISVDPNWEIDKYRDY